jgi:hypothetical protein
MQEQLESWPMAARYWTEMHSRGPADLGTSQAGI